MRKDIRILFDGDNTGFDFSEPVLDFESIIQDALVNTATIRGSDPIYEDRGTNLLSEAVKGNLIDINSAIHASNFASIDTLLFMRQTEDNLTNPLRLSMYELQPVNFTYSGLQLNATFISSDGETIGTSVEV